jgi:hypothetical protein
MLITKNKNQSNDWTLHILPDAPSPFAAIHASPAKYKTRHDGTKQNQKIPDQTRQNKSNKTRQDMVRQGKARQTRQDQTRPDQTLNLTQTQTKTNINTDAKTGDP